MDNSRLPVETCEQIIDSLIYACRLYGESEYRPWYLTALVCSAWLPRSRFNLYSKVVVWTPE
ncbi:hypothetical protein C8Q74DRAFT_1190513 [Fomes fomentarius]|nr:hypothetical protein C8Q74DRAFT_1190513 [Fomes fomentarius]